MQYKVTRKYIKNIIIKIDRFGSIKVSAPYWVKFEDISNFVESKKQWIMTKQQDIQNRPIKNIQKYEDGKRIFYFEKSFTLKIILDSRNKILQNDDILEVHTTDLNNTKNIERLILNWYKIKSKDDIQFIISKYQNIIKKEVKQIKLRNMLTRWGSCNVKKAFITLNTTLFDKPKICFEYVLLHELVHLIHANHGSGFYNTLESIMPDWHKIKRILES